MDFENVACLDVDMANTVVKIPMDFENVACLDEDIANTVVKIGGYVWFASADLDSKWLREGGMVFASPIEKQSSKQQEVNYVTESTATEYSPVYVDPQDGLKAADKIVSLPGQPNGINFDQYSGYVRVDPNAGRALSTILPSLRILLASLLCCG
ncbi:hypothetical protein TEA_025834 [Camellia sinensis var. sinensis]|uniref:Uncharacterized protein n=1 Tax=Camellia sinensis var. sinensis TaxID=542762 RepID=A0A4S4DU34_CAMSN|nr:hypothetical protein TEA_025834 [Camellia sinensis var. sinensis]